MLETRAVTTRINIAGRTSDLDARPGTMTLFSADSEIRVQQVDCDQAHRILVHFDVAAHRRQSLFDDELVTTPLRASHEFHDAPLANVLAEMLREIRQGCPNGSCSRNRCRWAWALHLCRTRGRPRPASRRRARPVDADGSGRTCATDRQRADRRTLADGARGSVNLSKPHFVRLFRNTAGTSPHRYIVRMRTERARRMIQTSELPLVEIAAATGFASQSHLGRIFRQTYGVTPAMLRKQSVRRGRSRG
jgi:AraC family transcriptional regulator